MNTFLAHQGIDHVLSGDFYEKDDQIYWGKHDSLLFNDALTFLQDSPSSPRLDIYLTLSTHGPYDFPGKESLISQLKKDYRNKLDQDQYAHLEDYSQELAAYFYTDKQLRVFFEKMKKRDDFKNTIFVLTGDHSVARHTQNFSLKKYHVPLLIYSPKLTRSKRIQAIHSHYDVAPSLLSLLAEKFSVKIPSRASWLGEDLDTLRHFSTTSPIPAMNISRRVEDFFHKNHALSEGMVYTLSEGFNMLPDASPQLLQEMQNHLDLYQSINHYVCEQNKLLPPSIYSDWGNNFIPYEHVHQEHVHIDSTVSIHKFAQLGVNTSKGNWKFKIDFTADWDTSLHVDDLPHFVIQMDAGKKNLSFCLMPFKHCIQEGKYSITLETALSSDQIHQQIPCILKAYLGNDRHVAITLKDVSIQTQSLTTFQR